MVIAKKKNRNVTILSAIKRQETVVSQITFITGVKRKSSLPC